MLGIIAGILLAFIFNPQMSVIDDNCHYMNVARAIYTGQGLTNINIDPPTPETLITPLFPTILAGFMKIAGHAKPVVAIKIFMMLCFLTALLFASHIFEKYFKLNRWIILLFAILTPMVVVVSYMSTMILTHSPYILLTTLVILSFLNYRESRSTKHFILATLFTFLAIAIRFPGLPIFFAGFLWLLYKKDYKKAIIYFFIIAIPLGIWFLWGLNAQQSYAVQLDIQEAETTGKLDYLAKLINRFFRNLGRYFLGYIPQFFGIRPGSRIPRFQSVFAYITWPQFTAGIIIAILVFFTFIRRLIKKQIILPFLFIIVYFLTIAPASSSMMRYASYLYFWLFLALVLAFRDIFRLLKLPVIAQTIIVVLLFGFQFYIYVPAHAKLAKKTNEKIKYYNSPNQAPDKIINTEFYGSEVYYWQKMDAYLFCRDSLPESARIAGSMRRSGAFYLGRPIIYSLEFEKKIRELKGIEDTLEFKPKLQEYSDSFMLWLLEKNTTHVIRTKDAIPSILLDPAISNYRNCFVMLKMFEADRPENNIFVYELDTTCLRNNLVEINEDFKTIVESIGLFIEQGKMQTVIQMNEYREKFFDEENKIKKLLDYHIENDDTVMANRVYRAADFMYPDDFDIPLTYSLALYRNTDSAKATEIIKKLDHSKLVKKVIQDKNPEHILAMGLYYDQIDDDENSLRFLTRTYKYGRAKPEYFLALLNYLDEAGKTALMDTVINTVDYSMETRSDSMYYNMIIKKYGKSQ